MLEHTEQEIKYLYGKTIWDMTEKELTDYDLWDFWLALVKLNAAFSDED